MKKLALAIGLAITLFAGAASASDMSVQEFLTTASRIPQNPTALLRADTRRLMGEFRGAVRTVRAEQATARSANQRPASCMPDKVSLSPDAILDRFNAIPASRRSISVTQAVREWMAERYPCSS